MRLLVTGATGFLGWRSATLLGDMGHDVLWVARPGGAERAHAREIETVEIDAGDPRIGELVAGRDAVLHFAGVPDPATARADPARAVRENAGTTANLLDACREHGCALVYPSTVRAGIDPPPDAYALSKRLGEAACRMHPASSVVLRTTSVYGPGQVAWEGATGAIASFAARAIEGSPIVIVGDPDRTRDFLYVDDLVGAIETIVTEGRWNETFTIASGEPTSLRAAAELVRDAVGSEVEIRIEARELAAGENESYAATPEAPGVRFRPRPLPEGIATYVAWILSHPAAQGRARA